MGFPRVAHTETEHNKPSRQRSFLLHPFVPAGVHFSDPGPSFLPSRRRFGGRRRRLNSVELYQETLLVERATNRRRPRPLDLENSARNGRRGRGRRAQAAAAATASERRTRRAPGSDASYRPLFLPPTQKAKRALARAPVLTPSSGTQTILLTYARARHGVPDIFRLILLFFMLNSIPLLHSPVWRSSA